MRRSVLLAMSTVLAAMTGAGLLAAFVAVRPPPLPVMVDSASAAGNRAAVQRFYEAVNAGIATGDPAPLGAVLGPGYAEPGAVGTEPHGRDDLERYVRALHEAIPGARLVAEVVVAEDDRALALVRVDGAELGAVLGLTLVEPTIWPPVDAFHLVAGRIAERAGIGERRVLVERQVQIPLELPRSGERTVTVQRIALPPEASRRAPAVDGARVLVVETGSALMATARLPGEGPARDAPPTRGAGEFLVVPAGAGYAIGNPGPESAEVLEVLVTELGSLSYAHPVGAPAPDAEGQPAQILAGGTSLVVLTPHVTLAVGQVTLAPGAALTWNGPEGPVLVFVEAGELELDTRGGSAASPALVRRSANGLSAPDDRATLAAGDGVQIDAATAAEVRNVGDGPLIVRLVTITPATSGRGTGR